MELVEELPYGIAVEIEKLEEEDEQLVVHAVIWVDRAGQKPIVIGAKGSRLKRIGQKAREELNARLGRRLHLNLWVKVREDWADDARALAQLGHGMSDLMQPRERITLEPAFVLHSREYRDTSRILDVFSARHGRLTLFARGARGPKSKLASLLMPFRPLLVSWSGRGDAAQLTGAEPHGEALPLPARQVMSGFYLNELIISLTTRHDPQPQLFEDYAAALRRLRATASPSRRCACSRSACWHRSATAWSSRSTREAYYQFPRRRRAWPRCAKMRPVPTPAAACWRCSEEDAARRASRSTSRAACCARRWITVSKAASCARAPWRVRWRGEGNP